MGHNLSFLSHSPHLDESVDPVLLLIVMSVNPSDALNAMYFCPQQLIETDDPGTCRVRVSVF